MTAIAGDLHNHSTASDGEFSPSELIALYASKDIQYVSLTDHDTIAGIPEALEQGRKLGINVIPGIEITIRFKKSYFTGSLHLLAYFPEHYLNNSNFIETLNSVISCGRGISLTKNRIDSINNTFGPDGITPLLKKELRLEEIIKFGNNISRRHFAQTLTYEHGIDDKTIINKIIGNNSPAYIPSGVDIEQLRPLKRFNMIKILAHPAAGSFPGESHYKEVLPPFEIVKQILPEFFDHDICGIDGMEVFYPGHTSEHQRELFDYTQKKHLIATGGSDCHDSILRPIATNGLNRDLMNIFLNRFNQLL